MDEDKNQKNTNKDSNVRNKLMQNVTTKPVSEVSKKTMTIDSAKSNNIHDNEPIDNETNSMRVILPVFIENEQKYAESQVERKRKIQSSPAKSQRRFSQDSSTLEHLMNVSRMIVSKISLYMCPRLTSPIEECNKSMDVCMSVC